MSEEVNTTNKKITPNILWAQTLEKVYLTIMISESQNNTFQINEGKTIVFKSQSGGQEYEFEFIIDDPVKDYSMNVTSRKVTITLDKTEEAWWVRLTENPLYKNYIKVDWDRWQDEDSEEEPMMGGMPGMESMMGGMPGMESMMGGMPGMESMMGGMPGMESMFNNMRGNDNEDYDESDNDDEDEGDEDEDTSEEEINTEGMTDMLSDICASENMTEGITEVATEVSTEGITEVLTEGITELATDGVTEVVTDGVTEVVTDGVTEVSTDRVTEMS